jgi:hypothetical protein
LGEATLHSLLERADGKTGGVSENVELSGLECCCHMHNTTGSAEYHPDLSAVSDKNYLPSSTLHLMPALSLPQTFTPIVMINHSNNNNNNNNNQVNPTPKINITQRNDVFFNQGNQFPSVPASISTKSDNLVSVAEATSSFDFPQLIVPAVAFNSNLGQSNQPPLFFKEFPADNGANITANFAKIETNAIDPHSTSSSQRTRRKTSKNAATVSLNSQGIDKNKQRHNASEQRRRDKINKLFEELKTLVPDCKNSKYNILERTIQYIKHLISDSSSLIHANYLTENENRLLFLDIQQHHPNSAGTLSRQSNNTFPTQQDNKQNHLSNVSDSNSHLINEINNGNISDTQKVRATSNYETAFLNTNRKVVQDDGRKGTLVTSAESTSRNHSLPSTSTLHNVNNFLHISNPSLERFQ